MLGERRSEVKVAERRDQSFQPGNLTDCAGPKTAKSVRFPV